MAFQLKPQRKESVNKTIRFPLSLIHRIEKAIVNQDANFSQFVIQACEFALESLPVEDEKHTQKTEELIKK